MATKTAIFTSLIPAIKALYVSLGPVGWIILILTTAISAFALAWHNNFLGIREITGKVLTWIATNVQKLGPVWEGVIRGVLTMTNFAIKALNLLP